MRSDGRLAVWVTLGSSCCITAASCTAAPVPESPCDFSSERCAPSTPVCETSSRRCSHACTATADCADLTRQTSCDTTSGLCTVPCTADSVGAFACVGGDRHWCDAEPTLPCTICPSACGTGTYCAGTACAPLIAAGEPCTTDVACTSRACTAAGRCSVEQGQACTAESCDGTCANGRDGSTYCLRSRCPSDCDTRTDGGFEWYCARYADGFEVCAPIERCIWEGGCSTFTSATCGQSCRSGGGCWTYCIPNEISPDAP